MKQLKINKTFLIILLGILAAIGPFTIDMYIPGFQRIAEDLYTDDRHVAFTMTSYFIGIAIGQLIYGPIVDKYGRKKPLLIGLIIYVIAAIGITFSPSIDMMIGLRFLQALGACAGMVVSTSVISDVYEVQYRAKAFSSIMLVMGVAPLIAPTVGSFFVEKFDWYYVFYFLAGFGLFVFLLIYFFLPETSRYMHSDKLRMGKILGDYFQILKNRRFILYTLSGSISMSIMFAYVTSASFIFLSYYNLDKATFSILFAINATGFISGGYLNGFLTKYVNYIKLAKIASITLMIIVSIVLGIFFWFKEVSAYTLVGCLFSILFTVGFINPNATAASLAPFTGNAGAASALSGSFRMGMGAVVAAIIGLFQGQSPITMLLTISFLAIFAFIFLFLAPQKTS